MLQKCIYSIVLLFFCTQILTAQTVEKELKKDTITASVTKKIKKKPIFDQGIDPLSPARASFYSAVLPGLGQIYNKKYWKAPIVWAAIGTGVYFYLDNNKKFNRYRDAYKLSLAGKPHEFDGNGTSSKLTDEVLIRAQDFYKKNRDLSMFITIGLYALNILEANVDAHLPDKKIDTNLSFRPSFFTESITSQPMFGVSMNFKF